MGVSPKSCTLSSCLMLDADSEDPCKVKNGLYPAEEVGRKQAGRTGGVSQSD